MEKIVIRGRGAIPGIAEGAALVCPDSIAGNSGALGDLDGVIHEKSNPCCGRSIRDAILVIPCAKGSNGFSAHFKCAFLKGVRPAGWVSTKVDGRLGVALASLNLPAVVDFEGADPVKVIETGDWVKIDGTTGIVEIEKNRE
jgi:predicted aconitase with swiveling domain